MRRWQTVFLPYGKGLVEVLLAAENKHSHDDNSQNDQNGGNINEVLDRSGKAVGGPGRQIENHSKENYFKQKRELHIHFSHGKHLPDWKAEFFRNA